MHIKQIIDLSVLPARFNIKFKYAYTILSSINTLDELKEYRQLEYNSDNGTLILNKGISLLISPTSSKKEIISTIICDNYGKRQ